MDASILIPSYNDREKLLDCLAHLSRQTLSPQRFEVVVVIDGSTDGSAEAARALPVPFELRVVEQPNSGRAAALNHAARLARGTVLIVIDSDILAVPDFALAHLEAHRGGDVVIGPIPLSPKSPVNFLTEGVRRWADRHEREMLERGGPSHCSQIYGANLSIARADFERLGGYRTDLRRTEDFYLGKKILEAGMPVAFEPRARAEHVYDKTIHAWCRDFYVDGRCHAKLVLEFPEEKPRLRVGRFHPQTLAKRVLRPLAASDGWTGRAVLAAARLFLETCRRLGLRGRWLTSCQGVVGDALFWKGVRDELGDARRFAAFISPSA